MIQLVLPFIPPTANHTQKHALRGRRIMRYNTPVYNDFQGLVLSCLASSDDLTGVDNLKAFTAFLAKPHKVKISVHTPRVLTKKGEVSKTFGDVDNFIKPLLDAIYKPLNANDALVMQVTASKHDADEEYIVIDWEAV